MIGILASWQAWSTGRVWVVARLAWSALLREVLASEQEHLLVEAADDRDLGLLLGGSRLRLRLRVGLGLLLIRL